MDCVERADGGADGPAELVRRGNRAVQAERLAWYPMDRARLVGLVTSVFTGFSKTWILFSEIVDNRACNYRYK